MFYIAIAAIDFHLYLRGKTEDQIKVGQWG
jgi:hypothetical protein